LIRILQLETVFKTKNVATTILIITNLTLIMLHSFFFLLTNHRFSSGSAGVQGKGEEGTFSS